MRDLSILVFGTILGLLISLGIYAKTYSCAPAPCPAPVVQPAPVADHTPEVSAYPLSTLDNQPMAPSSMHCAHVHTGEYSGRYRLDSGMVVKVFLTGGTDPSPDDLVENKTGVVCLSVPSYADHDDDNTYYFQSFTPEKLSAAMCPLGAWCQIVDGHVRVIAPGKPQ